MPTSPDDKSHPHDPPDPSNSNHDDDHDDDHGHDDVDDPTVIDGTSTVVDEPESASGMSKPVTVRTLLIVAGVALLVMCAAFVGAAFISRGPSAEDLINAARGTAPATASSSSATAASTENQSGSQASSSAVPASSSSSAAASITQPSPSSTPTSTSAPPSQACVTNPSPGFALAVPLTRDASDHDGVMADMAALRKAGAKFTTVIYQGGMVSKEDMWFWLDQASCNGFVSAVDIDPVLTKMSPVDAVAYIQALDAHTNFGGYIVNAISLPSDLSDAAKAKEVDDRTKFINETAGSHLAVTPVIAYPGLPTLAANVDSAKQYYHGNTIVPVYLPSGEISDAGLASTLTQVGQLAVALGGAAATAGIPAEDVAYTSRVLHDAGVVSLILYADDTHKGDMTYLAQASQAAATELART